jgi:hypothetical protein
MKLISCNAIQSKTQMNRILNVLLAILFANTVSYAAIDVSCNEKEVVSLVRHLPEVNNFFNAFEKINKKVIYSMDDHAEIVLLNDPRPRIVLHLSNEESEQGMYIVDVLEDRYLENKVLTFSRYYFDTKKKILFKYDEVTGDKKTIRLNSKEGCQ